MRVCLHSINSGKAHDQHLPNAASANEKSKNTGRTKIGDCGARPRPHAGLLWVLAGLLSFAGALTNTYGYRRVVNTQRANVAAYIEIPFNCLRVVVQAALFMATRSPCSPSSAPPSLLPPRGGQRLAADMGGGCKKTDERTIERAYKGVGRRKRAAETRGIEAR